MTANPRRFSGIQTGEPCAIAIPATLVKDAAPS